MKKNPFLFRTAAGVVAALVVVIFPAIGKGDASCAAHIAAKDSRLDGRACLSERLEDPLELYMAPFGNNRNDGLTMGRPLRTLEGAEARLRDVLSGKPRDAIVHVAGGVYWNQRVRWSFSMPHNWVVIEGDPDDRPIFDGAGIEELDSNPRNQVEWMNIARGPTAATDEATNVVIRGLQVQNYLEAVWIHGARGGDNAYPASFGGNIIVDNRFIHIGAAYSQAREPNGFDTSHGAILMSGSHLNVIRDNVFANITNDAAFPKDHSTYGGLHAIYVMKYSHGNVIVDNTFERVFARGVVKFRDFSNFGLVRGNLFYDDTSLITITYCGLEQPPCTALPVQCPSSGVEFSDNVYQHYRKPGRARSTIEVDDHPANDSYCNSAAFWKDTGLNPTDPLNRVGGVQHLIQERNRRAILPPLSR